MASDNGIHAEKDQLYGLNAGVILARWSWVSDLGFVIFVQRGNFSNWQASPNAPMEQAHTLRRVPAYSFTKPEGPGASEMQWGLCMLVILFYCLGLLVIFTESPDVCQTSLGTACRM